MSGLVVLPRKLKGFLTASATTTTTSGIVFFAVRVGVFTEEVKGLFSCLGFYYVWVSVQRKLGNLGLCYGILGSLWLCFGKLGSFN